ncbi:UvrD-helicase domain-containing protein [Thalassospira xiamenensis]|uniref:UvrD-helicase domain-containing protein n=1 Tax=Thalassospira xiamenensis TaxID=220697 RepID=UPI000DED6D65|nr:UvrD-helicase domain-containing protein [Thalassospira xiamenensis]RCK40083.1 hypothetical protein TH24_12035 [Thalassospira xiamenensis]
MDETWWVDPSQLDPRQRQVVTADADEELLVVGPPGSGKTNILILRANYVRGSSPRMIFLTFTRTLAEFLKSGASVGRADQLQDSEIKTFIGWARGIIQHYGGELPDDDLPFEEMRRATIRQVQQVIDANGLCDLYDAIFIDEVQDFWRDELNIVRRLTEKLNAAGDSRQRIWSHREGLPTATSMVDRTITLEHHYRIGEHICSYADQIYPRAEGAAPLMDGCNYDEGLRPSSVTIVSSQSREESYAECIRRIKAQVRYISDEPIAIVTCRSATRDQFWEVLRTDPELSGRSIIQRSSQYTGFGPESQIRLMTIHSAKGSECRAVHILDADCFYDGNKELAFTAVTRAKTEVLVYHIGRLIGYMVPPSDEAPSFENAF